MGYSVAVCGSDGLDEITVTGETTVCEIRFGETKTYTISPEQFGIKRCELSELIGGTPVENAQITREILTGKERGAKRNAVLLNAGIKRYLGLMELRERRNDRFNDESTCEIRRVCESDKGSIRRSADMILSQMATK